MNRKKVSFLALMSILIFVVIFTFVKEEPKGIPIKANYTSFTETPADGGLSITYEKYTKIEQKKSNAEVYLFVSPVNGEKTIMVKNNEYVELIDLLLDGETLYIILKKSKVKEKIQGDEVGKVVRIGTEETYENVVVLKR